MHTFIKNKNTHDKKIGDNVTNCKLVILNIFINVNSGSRRAVGHHCQKERNEMSVPCCSILGKTNSATFFNDLTYWLNI